MLKQWLGDEAFYQGIRNYLKENAFKSVTQKQLLDQLTIAGQEYGILDLDIDLNEVISTWTRQPNFPLLTVALSEINSSFTVTQERMVVDIVSKLMYAQYFIYIISWKWLLG